MTIMLSNRNKYSAVFVMFITALECIAEDRIHMEGITVIGNKESPNQLYIVPWEPEKMEHSLEPSVPDGFFDDASAPVDRNVILRKLKTLNDDGFSAK